MNTKLLLWILIRHTFRVSVYGSTGMLLTVTKSKMWANEKLHEGMILKANLSEPRCMILTFLALFSRKSSWLRSFWLSLILSFLLFRWTFWFWDSQGDTMHADRNQDANGTYTEKRTHLNIDAGQISQHSTHFYYTTTLCWYKKR